MFVYNFAHLLERTGLVLMAAAVMTAEGSAMVGYVYLLFKQEHCGVGFKNNK